MAVNVDLRVIQLLAARLCHDLIGPVAAIANGVELLAEEDTEFAADAVSLVGDSARKANARLQFYRFAYGFSGGGLAGAPPFKLAQEFCAAAKFGLEYREPVRALSLEWQQLACNMLAIGGEALPRGGNLVLDAGPAGPRLEAIGEGAGPSQPLRDALASATAVAELNSRTVGSYFTAVLAQALGCRLVLAAWPGGFRLSAAAG